MTFKYTAALAALVLLTLPATGRAAPAAQTNALASLKSSYEVSKLDIAASCVESEKAALTQYGAAVDNLLTALKQKGDLKTYLVVETERKRFSDERTVLTATDTAPVLQPHVTAYYMSVDAAKSEFNQQLAALQKKYLAALDGLIKQLMKADKIEDAKAVMAERDTTAAGLAGVPSPVSPAAAPKAEPVAKPTSQPKLAKRGFPKDAVEWGGHHYLLIRATNSWTEAQAHCVQLGGHLAIIESQAEQNYLNTIRGGPCWVGVRKTDKGWTWVDGPPKGEVVQGIDHLICGSATFRGDYGFLAGGNWIGSRPESGYHEDFPCKQIPEYICEWEY